MYIYDLGDTTFSAIVFPVYSKASLYQNQMSQLICVAVGRALDQQQALSTTKIKQLVILPAKWVYLGVAENCNSGQASYGESQASLKNKGEGACFYQVLGGNA